MTLRKGFEETRSVDACEKEDLFGWCEGRKESFGCDVRMVKLKTNIPRH